MEWSDNILYSELNWMFDTHEHRALSTLCTHTVKCKQMHCCHSEYSYANIRHVFMALFGWIWYCLVQFKSVTSLLRCLQESNVSGIMQVPKALILEEISVFIANIFTEVLQLKAHTKICTENSKIVPLYRFGLLTFVLALRFLNPYHCTFRDAVFRMNVLSRTGID